MPVKQAPPQTTLPKKASPGSPRKGSGLTPASKSSPAGLPPPPSTPGVDRTVRLLAQFQRFARDFWGVICLALAVMTFFQLFAPKMPGGVLLSWWVSQLRHFLGWGAIWIVLGLGYLGLRLLQRKDTVWPRHIPLLQILLLEIGVFATIALWLLWRLDLLAADRGEMAALSLGRRNCCVFMAPSPGRFVVAGAFADPDCHALPVHRIGDCPASV